MPKKIYADASLAATMNNLTTASTTATTTGRVYYGAIHCPRHTIEMRSITIPLLGAMAENAVFFLSYGKVRRMMGERLVEEELGKLQLATAGGLRERLGCLC